MLPIHPAQAQSQAVSDVFATMLTTVSVFFILVTFPFTAWICIKVHTQHTQYFFIYLGQFIFAFTSWIFFYMDFFIMCNIAHFLFTFIYLFCSLWLFVHFVVYQLYCLLALDTWISPRGWTKYLPTYLLTHACNRKCCLINCICLCLWYKKSAFGPIQSVVQQTLAGGAGVWEGGDLSTGTGR